MESESRATLTPRASLLPDALPILKSEIFSTNPLPYWYKILEHTIPTLCILAMLSTHVLALFLTPTSRICDSNDYLLMGLDSVRVSGFFGIAFGLVVWITTQWLQEWSNRHTKRLLVTSSLIGLMSFSFSMSYSGTLPWLYSLFMNTCQNAAQGHT